MGELAAALGIDPPERDGRSSTTSSPSGLARRRPHPTDRRAKIVEATGKGKAIARRADEILATPPPSLSALDADELAALRRTLERVAGRE